MQENPEDPNGRSYLIGALLRSVEQDLAARAETLAEIVDNCVQALEGEPDDRDRQFLSRMARRTLHTYRELFPDQKLVRLEEKLVSAGTTAGMAWEPVVSRPRSVSENFVTDGDVFDGKPLYWRGVSWGVGEFKAGPDGLQFVRVSGLATALFTDAVFTGDVTVRARVSFNGASSESPRDPPLFNTGIHWIPVPGGGYAASVDHRGALHIRNWPAAYYPMASGQLDYTPVDEFLDVEFGSRGERLELRVWRVGEERPEEPQVHVDHGVYRSGAVLLASNSIPRSSKPLIVRSVQISEKAP